MGLITKIYQITNAFPSNERFGLTSQMQRAAVSVATNIAEGSAKSSNKDFARFLEMSVGSLLELETELTVSFNLKYIEDETCKILLDELIELQKMISSFKKRLNND